MDRARAILVALAGTLFAISLLLVRPFLQYFLLAVLLAYPLRPIQAKLEGKLGPRITAGTLVVGATVAIVLPVLWLVRVVIREGMRFRRQVRTGEFTFEEVEAWLADVTGEEVDVLETVQQVLRETGVGTLDGALGVFGTITNLFIGVALTMFLLYYFLKDADRFNDWLRATLPLPPHIHDALRRELDDVMWAVLASHVLIAVIQGLVAGIGLVVLGVPNAVFWTAVMVFLAVFPIIGSFLVWGPASLYLFSIGQPIAGGVLLVYGAIVVSFCDDFLRPLVINRYTETQLNPAAIIVGILGGVYLLGFIGVFFGPVVIGSLRASLDVYRREYVDDPSTTQQASDGEQVAEPQDRPGESPSVNPAEPANGVSAESMTGNSEEPSDPDASRSATGDSEEPSNVGSEEPENANAGESPGQTPGEPTNQE